MADSVVKLRIDSKEYDANIKRAGQALSDYMRKVRDGGGTLKYLDDGVMEAVQALGQLGTKADNTRGGLRELTQTIADLTVEYRALSDEDKNTDFGKGMSTAIQQLTERAGNMRDAMADTAAAINNAASDTRRFDQLAQGASLVTSGFQTMQGAAKLLGVEMGDNVEVLAKLQAAMAVTNGLTQIQTVLQKQSALMQGVMAVQAKAAAVAQALLTTETKAGTIAQIAFNAVANANPYVLLASAVAAVGLALVGFSKNAKQATDATNTETDAMKQAARMADIWKNTMQGTFSSLMTKYDALKRQWESLRTEHEKTEWIKKNQTALHDLGGAVNDVKSAEDFFNNNTDAVVQSFVRRAQAAARVAQLTELYRKQIELLDKKSQTSAAISEDAQKMGRSAKAGDEITDATFRSSRYGQVNAQGKWVFSEQGAKLYSGTDTSSAQSVMKIDVELQANQAEIDKVKSQITNEFSDVTVTPSGGGNGGNTIEEDKDDFVEIIGLIPNAEEAVRSLQQQIRDSWDEGEIADLKKKLRDAEQELQRLKKIGEEPVVVTNAAGIKSYISSIQQQLEHADYGTARYKGLSEQLADMTTLQNLVGESLKAGLGTAMFDVADELGADFWTRAMEGGVKDIDWQPIIDKINEARKKAKLDAITIDFRTGKINSKSNDEKKEDTNTISEISKMSGGISSLVSGVQQLGFEIPKGISDTINVLQGITTILTAIQTISTIKFWAGGGVVHAASGLMVPGNKYSGDLVPSMINSGELILNRAQQGVLAEELQGGGGQGVPMQPYVSGENVFLGVSNHLKRSGQGEIVTTSMLKRMGLM